MPSLEPPGWHGGGSSNNTHIGVEMCEPACIKYTGGAGAKFEPYRVRVTVTDLKIRAGAGKNNPSKGYIKPGVYTIVEEATGKGAAKWGKLKSGAGWIGLDFAKKSLISRVISLLLSAANAREWWRP